MKEENIDEESEVSDQEDPCEDSGSEQEDVLLHEENVNHEADQTPPKNGDSFEVAKTKKKVHKLSLKKTEDYNEKLKKRGVIYVARIPPRMTPTKLK